MKGIYMKNQHPLRAIDPTNLRVGDKVFYNGVFDCNQKARTVVKELNKRGQFVVQCEEDDAYIVVKPEHYIQAPLGYIMNRPFYKGDTLYGKATGYELVVTDANFYTQDFTWTKPKQKKQGWINIYTTDLCGGKIYPSEEVALKYKQPGYKATVSFIWEE